MNESRLLLPFVAFAGTVSWGTERVRVKTCLDSDGQIQGCCVSKQNVFSNSVVSAVISLVIVITHSIVINNWGKSKNFRSSEVPRLMFVKC